MDFRFAVVGVLIGVAAPFACAADLPARPLPVTGQQFVALREIERQPDHRAILAVHATYTSERERNMEYTRAADDLTTAATFATYGGLLLTFLICAAPL